MKRLLIIGFGRAALAALEQLAKLKHPFSITLMRGSGRPDSPDVPAWDAHRLRSHGVDVRDTVCTQSIDRHACVVRGCDASRTTFDRLILAADLETPNLARTAGLEVRSGVILNDFQQTSDAHIYALGAGAEHRGAIYTDEENIEEQARILAAHVTGLLPAAFAPIRTMKASAGSNLPPATKPSDALLISSSGSEPRWAARTPEPEDLPALAGAA